MPRLTLHPFMLSKSLLKNRWPEILIVLCALVIRLVWLAIKPPHFDEGVNGWFVDQMAQLGYFKYDPANYHGPLHFYVLFVALELFGRNLWAMRVPIALVSAAGVVMVLCFQRFLGRRVCGFAAAAMAISPGYVFYGRYAIHESWLVLFLLLTTWGLFAMHRDGTRASLCAVVFGITGMILTKETYIIHLACFLLACPCWWIANRLIPTDLPKAAQQLWRWTDVAGTTAIALLLILYFYTGNFLLPWGPALKNLYLTYAEWAHTGQAGNGHEKSQYDLHFPWLEFTGKDFKKHAITWFNYYWPMLIWRYEWASVLGFGGVVLAFWPRGNPWMRYLAIYGGGAVAAYTIVSYKTPWCIISLLWPLLFLFGYLVDAVLNLTREKAATWTVAGILFAATLFASIRLNFFHNTDEKEPYVYVQTYPAIYKLVDPLLEMARRDPANFHLAGIFMVSSYYPLPWMLGDFDHIAYWGLNDFKGPYDAPFLLVEKARVKEVRGQLKDAYFAEEVTLRNSQDACTVFFNANKFRAIFPGRTPEVNADRAPTE